MRLVLHIGTEKTGTTLLQEWLYANRDALSSKRVYLSDYLSKPNNRDLVAYFQGFFDDFYHGQGIKSAEDKAAYFSGFLDGFAAEIAAARKSHDAMIITSEHFHSRISVGRGEIEEIYGFLRHHFSSISVICYLRRQSDLRRSLYSTACRVSATTQFSDFQPGIDERSAYYNYHHFLNRWASVFGRSNMIVRVYDRSKLAGGDIRLDFLAAALPGLKASHLDFRVASVNEALSYLQTRVFAAVNAACSARTGDSSRRELSGVFKHSLGQLSELAQGEIVDFDAAEIQKRFTRSNRRLGEEFFEGRKIFETPEQVAPLDYYRKPQYSLAEVGDILGAVVSALANGVGERLLADSDAEVLRDAALNWESGALINAAQAAALMRIAARARPKGPLIRQKLKEWEMLERSAPEAPIRARRD